MILWIVGVCFLTATVGSAEECRSDARLKDFEVIKNESGNISINYTLEKIGKSNFNLDFTTTLKDDVSNSLLYQIEFDPSNDRSVMNINTNCDYLRAMVPLDEGAYQGDCTINIAWVVPFALEESTGLMTLNFNNEPLLTCKAIVEKFENCE